nr:hypothetical protein [Candidatus Sigynarchaeota archaeon]
METGELTPRHFQLKDGNPLNLLDIVKVPILKKDDRATMPYQTENFMIDEQTRWEKTGHFPKADIQRLIDNVDSLWNNGDRPGMNDRMPVELVMKKIKTSLILIKPEKIELKVSEEYKRIRVTAFFSFKGFDYQLRVTDLSVLREFSRKKLSDHQIQTGTLFCISLGEPFKGFCYKLVASVFYL